MDEWEKVYGDDPSKQWELDSLQAKLFQEQSASGGMFDGYQGYRKMQASIPEYVLMDDMKAGLKRVDVSKCCDEPPNCVCSGMDILIERVYHEYVEFAFEDWCKSLKSA